MRMAVVGAGRMGRRHMVAVKQLGLELVGICDHSKAALEEAGTEVSCPDDRWFTQPEVMLREAEPDGLIISTTATSHRDLTCLGAEYPLQSILCEKPMACSLAQCDDMIQATRAKGIRLAINHPFRFLERFQKIREIVQSEEFGGLVSMTLVAGNLGICMNAVHYFELFNWLTGETPEQVTGWLTEAPGPNPRGSQFKEMSGSVRVNTESGKSFYLVADERQGHGALLVLAGRYGQLIAGSISGDLQVEVRVPEDRSAPTTRYLGAADQRSVAAPSVDVVKGTTATIHALLHGAYPSGEEGRQAVAILVAAHLSSENSNTPIDLQDVHISRERTFSWA